MIQQESRLRVAEFRAEECSASKFSGAAAPYASIGDVFIATVKDAVPGANVKKGDVVLRRSADERRGAVPDGSYIRFDERSRADQRPAATSRDPIFGPVDASLATSASSHHHPRSGGDRSEDPQGRHSRSPVRRGPFGSGA